MAVDPQSATLPSPHEAPAGNEFTLTIEPGKRWTPLRLRALWRFRELFYFLVWRDIKVRYKQTALGALWAVIQPVMTMIVFTVIFGHFAKIPSNGVPYPIFSYTALLPWTFFSSALSLCSNSLVNSASLISKIYFPRLIVPVAASLVGMVDFCIAFLVLVGMMIAYHVTPTLAVVTLPLFLLLALVTALAVGIWLAALNVQYRDVRHIVPFLTQLWLYATPIVYPASLIKGNLRVILTLNPMASVVNGFRWAILGQNDLDWTALIISLAIAVLVLIGGLYYFRTTEQRFADLV